MILVTDIIHKKLHVKRYNCTFNGKQIKTHLKKKRIRSCLIRLAKNKTKGKKITP